MCGVHWPGVVYNQVPPFSKAPDVFLQLLTGASQPRSSCFQLKLYISLHPYPMFLSTFLNCVLPSPGISPSHLIGPYSSALIWKLPFSSASQHGYTHHHIPDTLQPWLNPYCLLNMLCIYLFIHSQMFIGYFFYTRHFPGHHDLKEHWHLLAFVPISPSV